MQQRLRGFGVDCISKYDMPLPMSKVLLDVGVELVIAPGARRRSHARGGQAPWLPFDGAQGRQGVSTPLFLRDEAKIDGRLVPFIPACGDLVRPIGTG